MVQKRVLLVTGVSGYWGSQVASRFIAESNHSSEDDDSNAEGQPKFHVIGLDIQAPDPEIKGLDFIQADIRNPLLVELLREEKVHTVCHLVFTDSTRPSENVFDVNVMGAIKVLGACAEAGVAAFIELLRDVAAFDGPTVVRRQVATLSLTFDHRVIDGGPAAHFLDRVGEVLGRPYLLM